MFIESRHESDKSSFPSALVAVTSRISISVVHCLFNQLGKGKLNHYMH